MIRSASYAQHMIRPTANYDAKLKIQISKRKTKKYCLNQFSAIENSQNSIDLSVKHLFFFCTASDLATETRTSKTDTSENLFSNAATLRFRTPRL